MWHCVKKPKYDSEKTKCVVMYCQHTFFNTHNWQMTSTQNMERSIYEKIFKYILKNGQVTWKATAKRISPNVRNEKMALYSRKLKWPLKCYHSRHILDSQKLKMSNNAKVSLQTKDTSTLLLLIGITFGGYNVTLSRISKAIQSPWLTFK